LIHFYKSFRLKMSALPTNFGGPGMAMSEYYHEGDDDVEGVDEDGVVKGVRVPFHGNDKTMNMNPLILANVTNSPYFKVDLLGLRTYHEIVDEIYYKVDHLEPWERGTRKTAGMSQTGMCGGVRGVSAGGVVSSAFCLLFKLHTIRLTKKQAYGLLNHVDSPYIRALGFMYLRFTLPPAEMWKWFEPYIEDEEEVDIKAGGGKNMTIGEFCRLILTRQEWFETRLPRIAVLAEKQIRAGLDERLQNMRQQREKVQEERMSVDRASQSRDQSARSSRDRDRSDRSDSKRDDRGEAKGRSRSKDSKRRSRSRSRDRKKSRSRERKRSSSRSKHSKKEKKHKRDRSRSRDKKKKSRKSRSRSRDRR